MRLHEIRSTKQTGSPKSHPLLLEISIDPVDWQRFRRLTEDDPAVRVLGYDDPMGGVMTVRIACASEAVRNALSNAW